VQTSKGKHPEASTSIVFTQFTQFTLYFYVPTNGCEKKMPQTVEQCCEAAVPNCTNLKVRVNIVNISFAWLKYSNNPLNAIKLVIGLSLLFGSFGVIMFMTIHTRPVISCISEWQKDSHELYELLVAKTVLQLLMKLSTSTSASAPELQDLSGM